VITSLKIAFVGLMLSTAIAIAKGFFEEEGIEIEDVGVIDIPQHVNALASGTVDAIALMTSEGLAAIDNGADLVQVAGDQSTKEGLEHMTVLLSHQSSDSLGLHLSRTAQGVFHQFKRDAGIVPHKIFGQ
jgi:ABC-type nitrate/sulfonate/bicarbonate transport system substrate-binding protein